MRLYARDGWPLETIKGKPITNFIRRVLLTDWTLTMKISNATKAVERRRAEGAKP